MRRRRQPAPRRFAPPPPGFHRDVDLESGEPNYEVEINWGFLAVILAVILVGFGILIPVVIMLWEAAL